MKCIRLLEKVSRGSVELAALSAPSLFNDTSSPRIVKMALPWLPEEEI